MYQKCFQKDAFILHFICHKRFSIFPLRKVAHGWNSGSTELFIHSGTQNLGCLLKAQHGCYFTGARRISGVYNTYSRFLLKA